MHDENTELELKQRLAEEITILRIEGTLFCFDPREARRRDGTITRVLKHADCHERPVTIDEPTLWVGYALTAADVGTLRDRAAVPSTISPAAIALRWTLAGPDGATAAPGGAGLVDGSTSHLDLTSVIGGAPSYQSGTLTYSLLDQGCTAMVAPSGQGILFKFHDAATNPLYLTNVVNNDEKQSLVLSGKPSGPGGTFTATSKADHLPSGRSPRPLRNTSCCHGSNSRPASAASSTASWPDDCE